MKRKRLPLQPVHELDGVVRFVPNRIVVTLLQMGGITMNQLACMDFTNAEWEQFSMLLGYSVSGFGDLSYVRNSTYFRVERMVKKMIEEAKAHVPPDGEQS